MARIFTLMTLCNVNTLRHLIYRRPQFHWHIGILIICWYGFSSLFNWFIKKTFDKHGSSLTSCAIQFLLGWILPLVLWPKQSRIFKKQLVMLLRGKPMAIHEVITNGSGLPTIQKPLLFQGVFPIHATLIVSLCHLLGSAFTIMSLEKAAVFYVHLIKVSD
jgi:hypothetical protein